MSKYMWFWLRWLLVLPVGILAVLAISFILRLVFQHLFFHLSSTIETNIVTVINAAVFVIVCAFVAPGHDERRMNIVLILFAVVIGVFIFLNLTGESILGFGMRFNNGWLNLTLAVIGACIGFALVPKNLRVSREKRALEGGSE